MPAEHAAAAPAIPLREAFDRFLAQTYTDPPSADDAHWAVRGQYRQLYQAFLAGCQVGMAPASETMHLLTDIRASLNAAVAKGAGR